MDVQISATPAYPSAKNSRCAFVGGSIRGAPAAAPGRRRWGPARWTPRAPPTPAAPRPPRTGPACSRRPPRLTRSRRRARSGDGGRRSGRRGHGPPSWRDPVSGASTGVVATIGAGKTAGAGDAVGAAAAGCPWTRRDGDEDTVIGTGRAGRHRLQLLPRRGDGGAGAAAGQAPAAPVGVRRSQRCQQPVRGGAAQLGAHLGQRGEQRRHGVGAQRGGVRRVEAQWPRPRGRRWRGRWSPSGFTTCRITSASSAVVSAPQAKRSRAPAQHRPREPAEHHAQPEHERGGVQPQLREPVRVLVQPHAVQARSP